MNQQIHEIKESIVSCIRDGAEYPYIFTTLTFGFYDNDGKLLPPEEIRKFWDKSEVYRTNRLIRNLLIEALGIDHFYFFVERHAPTYDKYGDVAREGRFHVHLITSGIDSSMLNNPNRKCRRLFSYIDAGHFHTDELSIELFNACCRKADWINRYRYSIKTEYLHTSGDLKDTIHYCLKEYQPDGKDFMDIINFNNSNLNRTSIGESHLVKTQ